MTLIASVKELSTGNLCLLSDTLVTTTGESKSEIELPLRLSKNDLKHYPDVGLHRKTYQPHPDIVLQFAGSFICGKSVARTVSENLPMLLKDIDGGAFLNLIRGTYSNQDLDGSSFIYSKASRSEDFVSSYRQEYINIDEKRENTLLLHTAGTGAPYATGEIEPEREIYFQQEYCTQETRALSYCLQKIIDLTIAEATLDTFGYNSFGSWYEVIELRSTGFHPITYTINLHRSFSDIEYGFGRRLCSIHCNNGILLTSFDPLSILDAKQLSTSNLDLKNWAIRDLFVKGDSKGSQAFDGPQFFGMESDYHYHIFSSEKGNEIFSHMSNKDIYTFERHPNGQSLYYFDVDEYFRLIKQHQAGLRT